MCCCSRYGVVLVSYGILCIYVWMTFGVNIVNIIWNKCVTKMVENILQLALCCFWPMCCLFFWLLGLVLLVSLYCSWLSIESSWHSCAQRVFLCILRIRYYYDLSFYFLFPLQVCLDVFCFHVFYVFAILLLLSFFIWFCQGCLLELFLFVCCLVHN